MHRPTSWLFVLLLPLLLLKACICSTEGVNRGDINLIGLDEEWRMGEELAAELEREVRPVDDAAMQQYLEQMGKRIVKHTEMADREWQFHVVADPTVNAFAIPGGHVYVNTGLIAAAETPAELAGVVAHEVGHGVARHGTERLTQAYGANVLARLLMGEETDVVERIVAEIVGRGTIAKFSRDDEREADALGLEAMYRAGYRPEAMAAMFETLLEQRQRRPNALERFFTSHPLTEERIQNTRAQARQLDERQEYVGDEAAFARMQRRAEAINAR